MPSNILKMIPLIQSVDLVKSNLKKKKRNSSDFINKATTNLVGISLISATANIIDDL